MNMLINVYVYFVAVCFVCTMTRLGGVIYANIAKKYRTSK